MRFGAIVTVLGFLVLACQNDKKNKEPQEPVSKTIDSTEQVNITSQPVQTDAYFRATGTEPFWTLELSVNGITLKLLDSVVKTPHAEPIRAMDANVKRYRITTEATILDIQISHIECTNAMSGQQFPYSVTIDYGSTGSSDRKIMEGCGQYLTDYRLHDIWVLERINGTAIDRNDYPTELPVLEINSAQNTFLGTTGCNQMTGKLFYELGILRFTNVATTKKMCVPDKGQEQTFLTALSGSNNYKIENNRLYLLTGDKESLVFKKVD